MKKNKHDHKGTKILKLSIFASMMLAPLSAIAFKCAYVTFNKNAKDSYYGETINQEIIEDINYDEMEQGQKYIFNNTSFVTPYDISNRANISVSKVIDRTGTYDLTGVNKLQLFMYPTTNATQCVLYCLNGNTNVRQYQLASGYVNIEFIFNSYIDNQATLQYFNYFKQVNYNKYSYLDNAFYYAIEETMESQYFAWARTSALYTATSALTTGMGINTQAVPTLIVYWLVLTLIYIVLDIVIELFTFLTHNFMQRTE